MSDAAVPIAASTVAMLRDAAPGGVEVCMLRRPSRSSFAAGAYVFPGGALDASDGEPEDGDTAFRVAGIREVLEETGIFIGDGGADSARIAAARSRLLAGDSVGSALGEQRLRMAPESLVYAGRFVTPEKAPKRYDTRFFLLRAPSGQDAVFHAEEAVEGGWYRPGDMLAHEHPTLMPPTRVMCHAFSVHDSVDEIIGALSAEPIEVMSITPEVISRWLQLRGGSA